MVCGGNQTKDGEEGGGGGGPFTITYCWSKGKEHADFRRNDLLNGQVLMVLTAHKSHGSAPLVTNSWEDQLKTLGIEVTEDQWETLIQRAVLEPKMRAYLLYNSRGLRMAIAAVVYVTLWINLYSVLQIFSVGQSWKVIILVTLVVLVAGLVIQIIICHYQGKMNVNTDMRLMAANEAFMKFGFLVGMTDISDKNWAVPQLWFVHFDIGPCLQSLTDSLLTLREVRRDSSPGCHQESTLTQSCTHTHAHPRERKPGKGYSRILSGLLPLGHCHFYQSALKRNLEHVGIIVETTLLPSWEDQLNNSLEETSLLPGTKKGDKNSVAHREFLHLVSDRAPETMSQHLLTVFSSYYVRLLVSGQLPEVHTGQHKTLGHQPCLCQFVKATMLGKEFCGFLQRC
ncbi:LOW QUALITY PROTEIN: transmembrane protein 268 [Vipera latastei]